VREAIANCARHGKAQEVELRCNLHEGQLMLTVSDNGIGFADNANDHKPQTIMERVNNLGGLLHIRAEAGWTHLEVTLPIGEIK
jgi:signal transduction histidine kinase